MDRRITLRERRPGEWHADGINYGPGGLELVARNRRAIVLRAPGHSYNFSGVRGLRDDRYIPLTIFVFTIIEELVSNELTVSPLIDWKPARVPKGKQK